jgi:hypothetical protein
LGFEIAFPVADGNSSNEDELGKDENLELEAKMKEKKKRRI